MREYGGTTKRAYIRLMLDLSHFGRACLATGDKQRKSRQAISAPGVPVSSHDVLFVQGCWYPDPQLPKIHSSRDVPETHTPRHLSTQ